MIPRIVIPPPFGNYIGLSDALRIRGSYTAEARPGLWGQVFRTLRPVQGGWRNGIGLRNPGIKSIKKFDRKSMYSIAPLVLDDFMVFYHNMPSKTMVEINLGCPNAATPAMPHDTILRNFLTKFSVVSVKLPPTRNAITMMGICYRAGIRHFHLCNTLPSFNGGISGDQLRSWSLGHIAWVKMYLPDAHVVGGGGIYSPKDVDLYHNAGADSFSLGTVWLTPWKVPAILKRVRQMDC